MTFSVSRRADGKCFCGAIAIEASTSMVITLGAPSNLHGHSSCGPMQTLSLKPTVQATTAGTAGLVTAAIPANGWARCPPFCSCGANW
jgi:hypothetical protein